MMSLRRPPPLPIESARRAFPLGASRPGWQLCDEQSGVEAFYHKAPQINPETHAAPRTPFNPVRFPSVTMAPPARCLGSTLFGAHAVWTPRCYGAGISLAPSFSCFHFSILAWFSQPVDVPAPMLPPPRRPGTSTLHQARPSQPSHGIL